MVGKQSGRILSLLPLAPAPRLLFTVLIAVALMLPALALGQKLDAAMANPTPLPAMEETTILAEAIEAEASEAGAQATAPAIAPAGMAPALQAKPSSEPFKPTPSPHAYGPDSLPDLVVEISPVSDAFVGESTLVAVKTRNNGTAAAGESRTSLVFEDNAEWIAGNFPQPPLQPGEEQWTYYNYTCRHPLRARAVSTADANNQVTESNEGNNVGTAEFACRYAGPTVTIQTQLYDFLDNSAKIAETSRTDDAAGGLVGNGITSGGYYFSPTLFPDLVYRGPVANLGTYSVTQTDGYYATARSYYDFTDDMYLADRARLAYTINFSEPIPYHIDIFNGTVEGRPWNDDKITANRNVSIQFLGDTYVITDFENGTAEERPSISLGKTAVFRQMLVGESIVVNGFNLTLVGISPINGPYAYFNLTENGAQVDYFNMSAGAPDYVRLGFILRVRDVFVGGGNTSYAEVVAYSSKITLRDGQPLLFVGDNATTQLNRDAGWIANLSFGQYAIGSHAVTSLKRIMLGGPVSSRLPNGGQFNLIASPVSKSLVFEGITPVDRDRLEVTAIGRRTMDRMTGYPGDGSPHGTNVDVNATEIKSGYGFAFNVGGKNYDTVWADKFNGRLIVHDTTGPQSNYTTPPDAQDNVLNYHYPEEGAVGAIQLYTINQRAAPLGLSNTTPPRPPANNAMNFTGATTFFVSFGDAAGGESKAAAITIQFNGGTNAGSVTLSWTAVPGASFYKIYAWNGTAYYLGNTNSTTFDTGRLPPMATEGVTLPNDRPMVARLKVYERIVDYNSQLNGWFNIDLNPANPWFLYDEGAPLLTKYATSVSAGTPVTNFPQNSQITVEQGVVTPGGSILQTLSRTQAVLLYPKTRVHAVWRFVDVTGTTPQRPDLVTRFDKAAVGNFTYYPSNGIIFIPFNTNVTFYETTSNIGEGYAAPSTTVIGTVSGSHYLAKPSIGPNTSIQSTFTYKCRWDETINATADYFGEVGESNESNNFAGLYVGCIW